MSLIERDKALLWDMLAACREAEQFTAGASLQEFLADRKLCLAVERCLEIMGEAAGRVSETFRLKHPDMPWRILKGMRNILAHDYGRIDYEIIYRTVIEDLPSLRLSLDRAMRGPRRRRKKA